MLLAVALADLRHQRIPGLGRALIGFGLVLLLAAGLRLQIVRSLGDWGLELPTPAWGWRRVEVLVRILGFGFVSLGLLSVGRRAYSGAQDRAMQARLSEATQQLDSARGLLEGLLSSSMTSTGVVSAVRDAEGGIRDFRVRLCNEDMRRWFPLAGRKREEPLLSTADDSIPTQWLFEVLTGVVEGGKPYCGCHRRAGIGPAKWYEVVAVRHRDGACFTLADVTSRRNAEEQLRAAALTDALTKLPNRAHLRQRIEELIRVSREDPSRKFAVMFLDFDRFKAINDSLGHRFGDELLVSIGERLRASLRAIDTVCGPHHHMPARIGGDEFVVLIDGLLREQDAQIVAERIQSDLSRPYRIEGQEVMCTASIGIATSGGGYADADEILRDADLAMYSAKSSGRGRHVMFDRKMRQEADDRIRLEEDLRDAIEHERFLLEFQPIVAFETGQVVGFESLVRLAHPERGVIRPDDFLPMAEELGLMGRIGPWVMAHACRTLAAMRGRRGSGARQVYVTVNQSKREMLLGSLVRDVERVLGETGVPPDTLVIEITETMCAACLDEIRETLGKLKDLGVRVAIDDFGTGQSSYSTLHRLPVDMLKLDASFLRSTQGPRSSAAILQAMIEMAHNLQLTVVAEGVETQEDLALLQALGCDLGQGWLFGEATPPEAALRLLNGPRSRLAA